MYFWLMILGFQAVWFACAWGIGNHYPLLPIVISFIYLSFYIAKQSSKKEAYLFLFKIGVLGFVIDSALGLLSLVNFASPYPNPFQDFQPWWLTLLWLSFAASAKASFFWLEKRPQLAMGLGIIAGPIAYFSGKQFGAFVSIEPLGYILLGLAYAGVMYYLIQLIQYQKSHLK